MRHRILLYLGCLGLIVAAQAQPVDTPRGAAWTQRKLRNFVHPPEINSINGPWQPASCDQIYRDVTFVLVQLGARESDIHVDQRGCHVATALRSVDVTFWTLAARDPAAGNVSDAGVQAHWKTVALRGDCVYLQYITQKVLPLFATRNAKRIPRAVCERLGVGLYAQILMPG